MVMRESLHPNCVLLEQLLQPEVEAQWPEHIKLHSAGLDEIGLCCKDAI